MANLVSTTITGNVTASGNVTATAFSGDGSSLTNLPSSGAGNVEAWVNFNGTGTVAIRDSGNVSSITDNGTGDYTINFTTNLANANYSAIANPGRPTNGNFNAGATVHVLAVDSFVIRIRNQAATAQTDAEIVTGVVIM